MAKATITVEDNDDQTMSVTATFEPDLVLAEDATPAQSMAFRVMSMLNGDPDRIADDEEV